MNWDLTWGGDKSGLTLMAIYLICRKPAGQGGHYPQDRCKIKSVRAEYLIGHWSENIEIIRCAVGKDPATL